MFERLKRHWKCLLGRHAWGPWLPDLDDRIGRHGCVCGRCGHVLLHPFPPAFEHFAGCVSHCPRCGRRGVVVAMYGASIDGAGRAAGWVWACLECEVAAPGPFGVRLTWIRDAQGVVRTPEPL